MERELSTAHVDNFSGLLSRPCLLLSDFLPNLARFETINDIKYFKIKLMKKTLLILLSFALALVGCKYDDSSLWEEVNAQKAKLATLESTVSSMNSNIGTLQSLVTSLQNKLTVNSVSKTDDGYTIAFSDGTSAKIQNGADGETPLIGAKADSDGNYFWTVNGQWLLDATGAKVSTSNTPKLKIEEDQWMVSYDNGSTWTKIEGQSAYASGIFKTVDTTDTDAVFTLNDGTVITVPLTGTAKKLQLVFDETVFAQMRNGELLSTAYQIVAPDGAKVDFETFESDGWTVTLRPTDEKSGRISIKAPAKVTPTKVLFLLTDDQGGSFIKIINIGLNESEKPIVKTSYEVSYTGGELVIPIMSSTATIGDYGNNWMELIEVGDQVVLKLAENESYDWRTARVTLEDGTVVTITQLTKDALFLTKDVIKIDGRRQIVAVPVNTNITGITTTIKEGSDWLSATPSTRALSQKIYSFTAKRNTTEEERTAKVEFSGKGITQTCSIIQSVFEGDPSMDVTEAAAAEEGEEVELKESLVISVTKDGYVVTDGSSYLFVKDASNLSAFSTASFPGDYVKFKATATSLNGMPALGSVQDFEVTKTGGTFKISGPEFTSSFSSNVPAAVTINGAALTKDKSGNYNLAVQGYPKKLVIYNPASYASLDSFVPSKFTMTGIYYGESDGTAYIIYNDRKASEPLVNDGDQVSVSTFIANADKNKTLKVGPGLVVAAGATSFLMEQDGVRILVFQPGTNPKVGDMVVVEGKYTEYQGEPQVNSGAKVTTNSSGNSVTHPAAKDINSTFGSYSSTEREFVTFSGTLNISGNYYNINVDGSTTVTGSILKPAENISSLNGKEVTVKGYYIYHSGQGKYLYVIATEINGISLVGPTGSGGGDEPGGDNPGGGGNIEGGTISWDSASAWSGIGEKVISLTAGDYTITIDKQNGGTNPTVNASANDCRVYAKGTVTITTTGAAMTSIVFNISTQGKRRLAPITASTGTIAKQNVGDDTVSWSGSATSVTFTVGEKANYGSDGATKAGQFDFSSIEIN